MTSKMTRKWLYLNRTKCKKHVLALYVVIKYLNIGQHDDSYTILDKMRHLLVGCYVRNDV
jgi:hypothetical protein